MLISGMSAVVGGSQDGVRAWKFEERSVLTGVDCVINTGAGGRGLATGGRDFFAGEIQGDSCGGGDTARNIPSEGTKTVVGASILIFLTSGPSGMWWEALDMQQLSLH